MRSSLDGIVPDNDFFTAFIGDLPIDFQLNQGLPVPEASKKSAPIPPSTFVVPDIKKEMKQQEADSADAPVTRSKRPSRRSARQAQNVIKAQIDEAKQGTKRKRRNAASNEDEGLDLSLLAKEEKGTLSKEEQAKLKKQRRLLKNRAAAQQFRQRQKEYIASLETQVEEFGKSHETQSRRIQMLELENSIIKEHLSHLREFVTRSVLMVAPNTTPSMGVMNAINNADNVVPI